MALPLARVESTSEVPVEEVDEEVAPHLSDGEAEQPDEEPMANEEAEWQPMDEAERQRRTIEQLRERMARMGIDRVETESQVIAHMREDLNALKDRVLHASAIQRRRQWNEVSTADAATATAGRQTTPKEASMETEPSHVRAGVRTDRAVLKPNAAGASDAPAAVATHTAPAAMGRMHRRVLKLLNVRQARTGRLITGNLPKQLHNDWWWTRSLRRELSQPHSVQQP